MNDFLKWVLTDGHWMPDNPGHQSAGMGCVKVDCDAKFDCQKRRKVIVFVDEGNSTNWHAMGQQCNGKWASQNGVEQPIYNIKESPAEFYKKNFQPKGKVRQTCWLCHAPLVFN
jgi:hypothetical protein